MLAAAELNRAAQHIRSPERHTEAVVGEIDRAAHLVEPGQIAAPQHVHALQCGLPLDGGGLHVVERELEGDVQRYRPLRLDVVEHAAELPVDRAVEQVAQRIAGGRLRLAADAQHAAVETRQAAIDRAEPRAIRLGRGVAHVEAVRGDAQLAVDLGEFRPLRIGVHRGGAGGLPRRQQAARRVVEHAVLDLRAHLEGAAKRAILGRDVEGEVFERALDRKLHVLRPARGDGAAQVVAGVQGNVDGQIAPHRAGVGAAELPLQVDTAHALGRAAPAQRGLARRIGVGEIQALGVDQPLPGFVALPVEVGAQGVEAQPGRGVDQRQIESAATAELDLRFAALLRRAERA